MRKKAWVFGLPMLVVMLNSCLGASADITIKANGSGKIALEYRVSSMLESMGRLDGNEHWPTIPVGRADFERSVARIPGLSLKSFSAKEVRNRSSGKSDLVTKVMLEFSHTDALLAFLDASGSAASLRQNNGKNTLRLVLLDPSNDDNGVIDNDFRSLMRQITVGYEIRVSLNAPRNAALAVVPSSVSAAQIVSSGKKVSFTIGLEELIGLEGGLALEIGW
jgi:hypothetical protein